MMTRKDNDFLTYWNDGFAKIQSSGKFKKLCEEATKNHGEHISDLILLEGGTPPRREWYNTRTTHVQLQNICQLWIKNYQGIRNIIT